MANPYKAFQQLFNNIKTFDEGHITFDECLQTHSRICFNEVPSNKLKNFADGFTADATLNLFRLCCKVIDEEDQKSLERIKIDLGVETPNFTIKKIGDD